MVTSVPRQKVTPVDEVTRLTAERLVTSVIPAICFRMTGSFEKS